MSTQAHETGHGYGYGAYKADAPLLTPRATPLYAFSVFNYFLEAGSHD